MRRKQYARMQGKTDRPDLNLTAFND